MYMWWLIVKCGLVNLGVGVSGGRLDMVVFLGELD